MYKAVRMFNYKDGLGLEQEALKGVCEVEEHVCSTEDDVIKYCQDADAVMGIFEPLTARVINSLPKLKLIACKSMGYNYVDLEAAKAAAYALGVSEGIDPFMTLSFMALPVIPSLRLTTRGVFDVLTQRYV